jgi:hypothetical protein
VPKLSENGNARLSGRAPNLGIRRIRERTSAPETAAQAVRKKYGRRREQARITGIPPNKPECKSLILNDRTADSQTFNPRVTLAQNHATLGALEHNYSHEKATASPHESRLFVISIQTSQQRPMSRPGGLARQWTKSSGVRWPRTSQSTVKCLALRTLY